MTRFGGASSQDHQLKKEPGAAGTHLQNASAGEVVLSMQATNCGATIPLDRGSTPMTPEKGEAMRSRTNRVNVWLSDEELADLNEKVRRVGASLNHILIAANVRGLLEVPELRKALERNREVEVRIVDAYTRD